MKNLDEYLNSFNKNLDIKIKQSPAQSSNYTGENYIPKAKINKFKGLSVFSKILISAFASLAVLFTAFMLLVEDSDYLLVSSFYKVKHFISGEGNNGDKLDYFNIKDIVYLELTDSELEKIGVIKRDDSIIFNSESLYFPEFYDPPKIDADLIFYPPDDTNNRYYIPHHFIINKNNLTNNGYDTNKIHLLKTRYIVTHYRFNSFLQKFKFRGQFNLNKCAPVIMQSNHFYKNRVITSYLSSTMNCPIIGGYEDALDTIHKYFAKPSIPVSVNRLGIISKLIPVKITMNNYQKIKSSEFYATIDKYIIEKTECILWFVPTEEFLNALPERFGMRIRNELQLIEKIENGEITKKDACKELGNEESILGICRNYHDNLEITSIYPRPGRDDTRIKFTNGKEQLLTVIIYDMSGKEVRKIADQKSFSLGSHELFIDLSRMQSGIYFAVIIDVEGNAISSRFMKE